ncbi:MAG: DUF4189 domain-containing protein [Acidobacteria bacterium]|nr:DUF4189 domain-containing protein [Acidobacteriota bacterium]
MKRLIRLLILLALVAYPRTAHAQSMNQCIDSCWSSCSAEPLGSSSKSACVDRCIKYTCRASADVWGAIAYSKADKAYGYSFELDDEATARKVALDKCRKYGNACVVETAFKSACGAVAAGGSQVAWGIDRTRQAAEQRALAECARLGAKGCEIQTWVCSAPNAAGSGGTSAPPSPPPVPKTAAWGAIAYSAGDMGAGWAQGKADQSSAEREAMAACQQRGKACVLRASFNKQCGALAADRNFEGWGTSTDAREAQQAAMNECRKAGGTACALHIMFCSM